MNISIPKERRPSEYRAGLTPAGVRLLTEDGHTCLVEHDAGLGSGFSDEACHQVRAQSLALVLFTNHNRKFCTIRLIVPDIVAGNTDN